MSQRIITINLPDPPKSSSRKARSAFWRDVLTRRRSLASLYPVDAMERVDIVKEGVPARLLAVIAEDMAITKDKLYDIIGLPRTTANRKLHGGKTLSQDESERALGIARLIGQVSTIVQESGTPEGFDAAQWVAEWLNQPHPVLAGRRPAELMDTADGRSIVVDLISRMQSGAYA
jgi:putative toxin-antitoxin system antitoxin component (TIGR02293 family)